MSGLKEKAYESELSRKVTHNDDNECLGDFGRGRTHMAAILVGEVPQTFDPAVSEWSNPPARVAIHKHVAFGD